MNILVSYFHIAGRRGWQGLLELCASKRFPLMIDSGAFSAKTTGATIDHKAYMAFVRHITRAYPHVECVQLDVMGNEKATIENLETEYAAGLKTMPVCVSNAPQDVFCELVEKWSPRVCLSGAQDIDPLVFSRKLASFHKATNCRSKTHALGYSAGFHPVQSVAYTTDSSSWASSFSWGTVSFYDPFRGIVSQRYPKMKTASIDALPEAARRTLVMSGVTAEEFRGAFAGRSLFSLISFFTADAWLRMAERYEQAGKHFYFAQVNPKNLFQVILAMKHRKGLALDWAALKADIPEFMKNRDVIDLKIAEKLLDEALAKWNPHRELQGDVDRATLKLAIPKSMMGDASGGASHENGRPIEARKEFKSQRQHRRARGSRSS